MPPMSIPAATVLATAAMASAPAPAASSITFASWEELAAFIASTQEDAARKASGTSPERANRKAAIEKAIDAARFHSDEKQVGAESATRFPPSKAFELLKALDADPAAESCPMLVGNNASNYPVGRDGYPFTVCGNRLVSMNPNNDCWSDAHRRSNTPAQFVTG